MRRKKFDEEAQSGDTDSKIQLQRPPALHSPALRPHPLAALHAGLGGATHLHRVRHPISR